MGTCSVRNLASWLNSLRKVHLTIFWLRTFLFKDLIAIVLGLETLWPYSLMKPDFFRFRVFFQACSLLNEVGDPPFFYISDKTNSSYSGKSLIKKNQCWKIFKQTSLIEVAIECKYFYSKCRR